MLTALPKTLKDIIQNDNSCPNALIRFVINSYLELKLPLWPYKWRGGLIGGCGCLMLLLCSNEFSGKENSNYKK